MIYEIVMTGLSGDGIVGTTDNLEDAIDAARSKIVEGWINASIFASKKCVWNASVVDISSSIQ